MRKRFVAPFLTVLLAVTILVEPPTVQAQQEDFTLELTCDKDFYYLHGETIQVFATSNESVDVTLSVYRAGTTLVYENIKTANATWNLPTLAQSPDHYKFVATSGNRTVTIWRTLLNTGGYVPASLPFSHVYQGINYTLEGRRFRAEQGDDYFEIVYPKIPFKHRTRFFRNNMTFVVRLDNQTQGWAVDLVYATVYDGLKWTINGTLDDPKTFDMVCTHNPLRAWRKRLDSLESDSKLHFDWSDLRRAQHAFTWNQTTKTLHVEIPSTFSIDPIFGGDDGGFDSAGQYTGWTGTVGSPVEVSSPIHHGVNASKQNYTANFQSHYPYKYGLNSDPFYVRFYFQIDTLPSSGFFFQMVRALDTGFTTIWTLELFRNATGTYMKLVTTRPSATTIYGAYTIAADTWYSIEVGFDVDASAGFHKVWVDGNLVIDDSGIDTSGNNQDKIRVGMANGGDSQSRCTYIDCVVVDSSYIGPEEVGVTENFWGTVTQTFSISHLMGWTFITYGTVTQVFSVTSTQFWMLDLYGIVNQVFTVDSLAQIIQTTRTFWGTVTQTFTINSVADIIQTTRTFLGTITQVFTIESTQDFTIPLLNFWGTITHAIAITGTSVFTTPDVYATTGFVLAAMFLLLIVGAPAVLLVLGSRRR